ncbi:MAG TPA: DUF29 domain-containing protein [Gemmatales bacterium]|nr:DUF29 domain-containing protein [Gemmatales bacterium]
MIKQTQPTLAQLFEQDETAWLEAMADLIRLEQFDQLDYPHLLEYLDDMARRDKREVESRLAVLLSHQLKWEYQKEKRSPSWQATIEAQRQELILLLESASLRNHADLKLQKSYLAAVRLAMAETSLAEDIFPSLCPYSLESLRLDSE